MLTQTMATLREATASSIWSSGALTLTDTIIQNNRAKTGDGVGIFRFGTANATIHRQHDYKKHGGGNGGCIRGATPTGWHLLNNYDINCEHPFAMVTLTLGLWATSWQSQRKCDQGCGQPDNHRAPDRACLGGGTTVNARPIITT